MDAVNLGGSAITVLAQFIPTPDETGRVSKFVLQQHTKGPSKTNSDGSKEDKSTPTSTAPIESGNNSTLKIDAKRMNELKIGKAEQYIYFMSTVLTSNYF